MTQAPQREMTIEEWAELDVDVPGELVDGRLEDDEVGGVLHEVLVGILTRTLGFWAAPRGGAACGSELKLIVGARRGRKPDCAVFVPRRSPARPLRPSI
jgi:hypothetical protein